ncbi:hypothetical protein GCM10027341_33580 [Spirosoma knui]
MPTQVSAQPTPTKQLIHVLRIIESWQEVPYDEIIGGPALVRASVRSRLEGDLNGESWAEYLITYHSDGSSSFVSTDRVIGQIGDRSGSFVVQGVGTYEYGTATGQLTIVPGSGTGDFTNLVGQGEWMGVTNRQATVTLTCELPAPLD